MAQTHALPAQPGWLERTFQLSERGTTVTTEVRAGLATFMVMAYIIFVNPSILGQVADPTGAKMPFSATLTVTCLTAG
ncbi:MAG: NCS2 family permease, partial [Armatimonadota bacterium]|nr:NCS2 family permease [Armatimonadota bacterium]